MNAGKVTKIETTGDARRFILDVMISIRDGDIPVDRAHAIAATMKVVNENLQAEINSAKVAMIAKEKGFDFGKIVEMGKKVITGDI